MKKCLKCNKIKYLNEIYRNRNICLDCNNLRRRLLAKKNKKITICEYCKKEYIKKSFSKKCSVKCRLISNIKINDKCWEWQGNLGKNGYGKIRNNLEHWSTHRLSYFIFKGEIPDDILVCHTCDNKKCINPDHLYLGTHKDNAQDALKKGLLKSTSGSKWSESTREKMKSRPGPDKKGDKHHLRKLTSKNIYEIRTMLDEGIKQAEIAKIYDVNPSCISNVKRKKSWCHI